jgi:hypothetical protein
MSVSRYRLEWFGPEKYGRHDGIEVTVFGSRARRYEDFTADDLELVADALGRSLLSEDNPTRTDEIVGRFGDALMGIIDTIRSSAGADPPS